jgi:hypothetical protein
MQYRAPETFVAGAKSMESGQAWHMFNISCSTFSASGYSDNTSHNHRHLVYRLSLNSSFAGICSHFLILLCDIQLIHVWRSRTPVAVRCAHFTSVPS